MGKATIEYDANGDARSFVGREAVDVFAMAVLASALKLYANTGMRVNRAYTPSAMMRTARHHLGDAAKGLKSRDYLQASLLLSAKVQIEKARIAEQATE